MLIILYIFCRLNDEHAEEMKNELAKGKQLGNKEIETREDYQKQIEDLHRELATQKNDHEKQMKYIDQQIEEEESRFKNEEKMAEKEHTIQLIVQKDAIMQLERHLKEQEDLVERLEKKNGEGSDEEKASLNKEISHLNKEIIEQDNLIAKLRVEIEILRRDLLSHKDQYDELELKTIKREKEYEEERTLVNEDILLQQDEEIQRQRSELVELKQQLITQREHFVELEQQLIEREAKRGTREGVYTG